MKHVALKVYEQVKNGDSIDTVELVQAMNHFKTTRDHLSVLGPVFRLAEVEANDIYMVLNGYLNARALNPVNRDTLHSS